MEVGRDYRDLSWYYYLTSIQVATHLAGLDICVSPPSRSRLTFTRVPETAYRVHPGPIWNPSMYHYVCLTSIHVLPHLYPCPKYLVPPPSMYHLTSIQVQKFFFNCHPYRGSPPFRPHLNLLDLCLISIQVLSHLTTSSKNLVSPSSRWRPTSIQIVITIFHLHSGPIPNPYRSQDVHLKPIHVLPHLHPGPMSIVSPPYMQSFTSNQYIVFASHLQPGPNCCNWPPSSSPFT